MLQYLNLAQSMELHDHKMMDLIPKLGMNSRLLDFCNQQYFMTIHSSLVFCLFNAKMLKGFYMLSFSFHV